MSHYPTTIRDLAGNAAVEEMELRECGGLGSSGFADEPAGAAVTWDDVDAMWVEEMERRDRDAATAFGGSGGDDDRTPPPAAAHPHYQRHVDQCAAYDDTDLLIGIGLCDEGRPAWGDDAERAAWLHAATAEVLRRLSGRKAA